MAKLIDHTTPRDRTGNTSMPGWDKRLQVIYVTHTGRDYCRESGPATPTMTHDEAVAWAEAHFDSIADTTALRTVSGFRIEFW